MDKACKNCHYLSNSTTCPICKSQSFTDRWRGFVIINDPSRSHIADQMGISMPGKYALRLG